MNRRIIIYHLYRILFIQHLYCLCIAFVIIAVVHYLRLLHLVNAELGRPKAHKMIDHNVRYLYRWGAGVYWCT
jgi:hypothetical protein